VVRPPGGGTEGRTTLVLLLDERRLEILVQPRLYAGELLDMVASQCGLREKEYFGLAVVDDAGHYTWLQLDRKVLDHDLPRKPQVLTVHFLVKFFIESIGHLADNQTVELFYLQARSLIWRGLLEVEADIVFQLAALGLQAGHGDYSDEVSTRTLLKKTTLLPAFVLKEQPSHTYCEDQVIEHYKKTAGQTRGQAVVNYMTIVESMPTYGVHYFEVYDKRSTPWWLGLSCKGIAQYTHKDRKVPCRVFMWKQLENLYFRDKKFSIEVHDAKRVVQTLSSFNLYEDALKLDSVSAKDELVDAISDSTTQVSVSRRSFNPGSIHVYQWYAQTSNLTKCIWQSAISQHQFYLDRKQARLRGHSAHRSLKEIARDLTRSTTSLSSASSASNLSLSGSSHSLAVSGSLASTEAETEESRRAKAEMAAALKARKEALEERLKEKNSQLKELCIKEGELTGELPSEIPLQPGEPLPVIRRRVGTEFALSEILINKSGNPEEEQLAALELEFEIQSKITSAALKLANDTSTGKSVRRQRKISYSQSQKKLKEIEFKLTTLKHATAGKQQKRAKQPRPGALTSQKHSDGQMIQSLGPRPGQRCQQPQDELRRGVSVPDLGQDGAGQEDVLEEEVPDNLVSPRSCPSSPRKQPVGLPNLPNLPHTDPVHLQSPVRAIQRGPATGYIPNSVYLRSSYRAKQYPTLSTRPNQSTSRPAGPVRAVWHPSDHHHHTLPSPYRNKFDANSGCDSPVGLYNCPQQRTSQAFSSLDDLDGLASMTGPPTARRDPAASHHYPSLERSAARKKQRPVQPAVAGDSRLAMAGDSGAAQVTLKPESRSMEDLEVLENAGARGSVRPRQQQRPNGAHHLDQLAMTSSQLDQLAADQLVARSMTSSQLDQLAADQLVASQQLDQLAASQQALDDLVYRTQQTTLRNTDEYPTVRHASGYDDVDGHAYPLPLPARRTTLLPGQTYPEPAASAVPLPAMHHSHTVAALREVFSPHRSNSRQTHLVHARKVETTFGLNDSVHTHSVIDAASASTPHIVAPPSLVATTSNPPHLATPPSHMSTPTSNDSDEPKPPLFPKQYWQRQHGSPWADTSLDSPAVPRKLKPPVPLPSPSMDPQASQDVNTSVDTVVSPADHPTGHQGSFIPYRETTKPFEMSDYYKYSSKFRKASASSLKSTESSTDSPDSPRSGSGTASQRSSTSRESVPPDLPARPVLAVPAVVRLQPREGQGSLQPREGQGSKESLHKDTPQGGLHGSKESLADAFSTEMLAWYEQKQNKPNPSQQNPQSGKPATLV